MCGIAGWMGSTTDDAVTVEKVRRMIALQSHRGPDATGIFHEDNIILGHSRLSIIDIHEHSNQPLSSTDGRYVISFNGEIYNHNEIRGELSRQGLTCRTTSDTEVLLESYRLYGTHCLDKFEGMFAFVIYDRRTRSLFCARDRLGEKPFYYSWSKNTGFIFSSEMAALISVFENRLTVDSSAFSSFLATSYSKSPATLFNEIRQLQAGHSLFLEADRPPIVKCYWSPLTAAENALTANPCTAEEFLSTFDKAVERCTTSDVPFGSFLSGGLDSTAVLDSITRQKLAGNTFSTYTLDYPDISFSESAIANHSARTLGVKFRNVSYVDYEPDLPNIIRLAAEIPIADPSFIPLYIIARAAHEDFKVMLGGDGGDELLNGYDTYRATLLSSALTRINLQPCHTALNRFLESKKLFSKNVSFSEKVWRLTAFHVPNDPIKSHMAWRTIFSAPEISELYPMDTGINTAAWMLDQITAKQNWTDEKSLPILTRASLIDYYSWLSDGVLRKLDSALMFNSVEGRTPFINHHLIEAGFRMPQKEKTSLRKGKLPIRKQLERSGLAHVCRQKKSGFGFPLDRLFRGSLREMLFDELTSDNTSGILSRKTILRYLNEHDLELANHGRKLYCLLILAIWYGKAVTH
ncbi:asparagine synthase (glutamine-hydrolyzing) [Methylomonas rosea]|uniref:asparagine synthase (glutamine-hydrolyzing) n=1 Tax=Methylomonas rosea TaxID=2952227 RepID=A0ABT1TYD4_9GAMM|nr:asparagine synthase (glutamine-hydrolyzing) [Methylomonas sp. WSC-7]MCQ8119782.1 asparagine synthase (glutamine-hydrolyzing) [Methylomonas sp. WSC-7]